MNYKNPTPIRIGQTGTFAGQNWQVVGRAVLGVVEDREIYCWHEFNLETTAGEVATLVFEQAENGPVWRWFTQFQPEYAMTVEDAASRQAGDLLNLEGTDVRITLVETSRIYFIEGKAPEGETLNSEASYFNAENGDEMVVVSWTGDEVEYYRGRTITGHEIRTAFRLNQPPDLSGIPTGGLSRFDRLAGSGTSAREIFDKISLWLALGLGLIVALAIFTMIFSAHSNISGRRDGITRSKASSSSLQVGMAGRLAYTDYHITGHALVEIAEVNLRFEQQEYFLRNKQGGEALLVSEFTPRSRDWVLFTPLNPIRPLTSVQAAAIKLGQTVNVDKMVAPVDALFSTTVENAEFDGTPEMINGETFYGFAGQRDSEYLLVRWNAAAIMFLKGQVLTSRSVLAAFTLASK